MRSFYDVDYMGCNPLLVIGHGDELNRHHKKQQYEEHQRKSLTGPVRGCQFRLQTIQTQSLPELPQNWGPGKGEEGWEGPLQLPEICQDGKVGCDSGNAIPHKD